MWYHPHWMLVGTAPTSAGQEVPEVLTLQEAKNLSGLCLRSFISSKNILHPKVICEEVSQGFSERGAVPSQQHKEKPLMSITQHSEQGTSGAG